MSSRLVKASQKLTDVSTKIRELKQRILYEPAKGLDKSSTKNYKILCSHVLFVKCILARRCLFQPKDVMKGGPLFMDVKTLEKMTVSKLREEALKFDDLVGVHGMDKPTLLRILKGKYGIVDHRTDNEILVEQKHALKEKIRQLKAEKAQALEAKDKKKVATLRKRLRQKRHALNKLIKQVKATA